MTIQNLEKNVDLFKFTTLKSKSIAEYFFVAKTKQDLIDIYKLSITEKLPLTILGGGSNIALISNLICGIVVKNAYIDKKIIDQADENVYYQVSSGYPTNKLVLETIDEGLSGLEYHLGLPGSIGGAIYMNSKWTNPLDYIGSHLEKAYVLTKEGEILERNQSYFNFAYDYSILQETKEILLDIVFKFKRDDKERLIEIANMSLEYRKKTQPSGVFTSGCFFRNITDEEKKVRKLISNSSGYLIDQCGLKGYQVGDFEISNDHANFIINKGKGKPEDLAKLLNLIKSKVKQKFNIDLREEVVLVN
ncbi:MAG: UDP-N-acetylmuramate dehydrogenase [bacterium]|nr:UDP-N-acetylmuramate dehydrogenase [bacterium]